MSNFLSPTQRVQIRAAAHEHWRHLDPDAEWGKTYDLGRAAIGLDTSEQLSFEGTENLGATMDDEEHAAVAALCQEMLRKSA